MTISEILDSIYKRARELGINLSALGIDDDEDVQIRALILFFNSMEDLDVEDVSVEEDSEEEEELELWLK